MTGALTRFGALLGSVLILLTLAVPAAFAEAKPPDPIPSDWIKRDVRVGIHEKTGEYCDQDDSDLKKRAKCRGPEAGELPGSVGVDEGSHDPKKALGYERELFKKWKDKNDDGSALYKKRAAYVQSCLKPGKTFALCMERAKDKHPDPVKGPGSWVAGKLSDMAADALKEAARHIGASVVWLLERFADVFNEVSTLTLGKTGIGSVMSIMGGISVLLATFLLLVQFGKLAISQQGGPLVTAITGLAKWAVILSVYTLATQTALNWSDELSTAIINSTFEGGGSGEKDATVAMREQLGTLFSGLAGGGGGIAAAGGASATGTGLVANAVGVVIVVGILCILAIGALWVEMLLRQAGIMILVAVMPVVLAGQMADSTREWWPKARNALIALILMKPVIVICFAIGFNAMAHGEGIQNVMVGLIIFILAGFAWPVLARFMTFTSNGAGNGAASGLIGAVGSSASSIFGGYQPAPGGAGMVGGGSGFTRALEEDNSTTAASGSNTAGGGFGPKAAKGGAGGFGSKAMGGVGLGLQAAAVGKDLLEGAGANTAAHAGLDQPGHTGGHVVIPPRQPRERGERPAASGTPGETPPGVAGGGPAPAQPPRLPVGQPGGVQVPPQGTGSDDSAPSGSPPAAPSGEGS